MASMLFAALATGSKGRKADIGGAQSGYSDSQT